MTPAALDSPEASIQIATAPTAAAAPSTAGMTTKVVKGSLWTLAGQVAPLAVSMIATPFTIRLLGSEGYGVLVLIGVIPNYFGFADFGMSLASTKFASEAYAENNREKEARVVGTSALIALFSALPVVLVLFLFSGPIIRFFGVAENLQWQAGVALKIASVTLIITFLSSVFNTPQLTRLRMDLNTLINSGIRVLGIAATPIVIYFGGGIVGVLLVLLVVSLLTLTSHLYVSARLLENRFGLSLNGEMVRPLLRFGGALVISTFAGILLGYAEKGLLARLASPEALAFYTVAFTFCTLITMFSGSMTQSLLPAFSQLRGEVNRERLNLLYSRFIRLNLIVLVPALVYLCIIARPLFTLWAGEEFGRQSTLPFYILLAGLAFNLPAYFANSAIISSGRTDVFAKIYWLELIPYIFIVWILTSRFGILGAASAWSLRVILDSVVQFAVARRVAGVSFQIESYILVPALCVMLIPLITFFFFPNHVPLIILTTLISSVIYAYVIWKYVLRIDETQWLTGKVGAYFTVVS